VLLRVSVFYNYHQGTTLYSALHTHTHTHTHTSTNKDGINMQPQDRTDSIHNVFDKVENAVEQGAVYLKWYVGVCN
jgi:hypothetical protein